MVGDIAPILKRAIARTLLFGDDKARSAQSELITSPHDCVAYPQLFSHTSPIIVGIYTDGTRTMRTIILLHGFLLGITSPLAHADADAERESLARIIHEIEALQPLLLEAKSAADPDARVRFRYD